NLSALLSRRFLRGRPGPCRQADRTAVPARSLRHSAAAERARGRAGRRRAMRNRAARLPEVSDTQQMRIRSAGPGELPALRDIERAAGAAFREVGMPDVADDEPPALDVLEHFRRAGRCWVAADQGSDRPVA